MIAIGLVNPKTPANYGSVLRAAECYGAQLVVSQGRRLALSKGYTDVTKAHRSIPALQVDDVMSAVPHGAIPVCIEFVDDAQSLVDYVHPKNAFYIFGPEDGSVPMEIRKRCRDVVYVPTKHCMNLAATVNVVLYDRLAKESK